MKFHHAWGIGIVHAPVFLFLHSGKQKGLKESHSNLLTSSPRVPRLPLAQLNVYGNIEQHPGGPHFHFARATLLSRSNSSKTSLPCHFESKNFESKNCRFLKSFITVKACLAMFSEPTLRNLRTDIQIFATRH